MAEYNPSKIIKDGNTYNFRDTTKIPLAGSNAISGSLIPSTDGTVNLGGPSYQWNNAYIKSLTINGVACGDILTHNASEFVDLTTAQTVGGQKTWTARQKYTGNNTRGILSVYNSSYTKGSATSVTELPIGTIFLGDGGNIGLANSIGFISCDLASTGNKTMLTFSAIKNEASSAERANLIVLYDKSDNTNPEKIICKGTVLPHSDNAYSFGTSTSKWKTFNGINPGALSLPGDTYITIDTTDFAWGANFTFTPSVNGYLFINLGTSDGIRALSLKTGRGEYYITNQKGIIRQTIPVYQGKLVTILASSSITETVGPGLTLFPCQGNV